MIIRAIVLIPFVAALLGLLLPRFARWIAVGQAAIVFVLAAIEFIGGPGGGSVSVSTVPPLRAGEVEIPLHLVSSPTVAGVAGIVGLVAFVIQMYAAWYLEHDDRYARFATTVSLFTGAMLLVVHSGDLVLTLLGWEVMGWCSYLLIGHWSREAFPRKAAHKAFMVTRIADIGFVLGVVGLAGGAGSTAIHTVVTTWAETERTGMRALLLSLLIIGILGKSAQFPFQDWLPDAMAGPTPASALIHAATMVAAGTVVLASLFEILVVTDVARWVLGVSTAITMLLAALLALAQSDLKRLLAWSTVSQVAIMLSGLAAATEEMGTGPGVFHMWSHAIFKALLFMTIGWLGLVAGGTSAKLLQGSARALPVARFLFGAGLLSLAGAPFIVGGMSKESVFESAYEGATAGGPGLLILISLLVTAVLTAMYSTRAYLVVSSSIKAQIPPEELADAHGHHEASPPSVALLAGLIVLGLLSLFGGVVVLGSWFKLPPVSLLWVVVALITVGLGAGGVMLRGRTGDFADGLPRGYVAAADGGLGFDALYRNVIVVPVLAIAALAARIDRSVLDGAIRSLVAGVAGLGSTGLKAHRGERPSTATALIAAGMLALALIGVVSWS